MQRARTGRRPRWGLGVLSLLPALAAGTGVAPSSFPAPTVRMPPVESVQTLDALTQQLRRNIWALYTHADEVRADVRGRTVQEDVDERLLRPEQVKRLAALETQAKAAETANEPVRLHQALAEAGILLEREWYRLRLLGSYWDYQYRIAAHVSNLERLQARLPPDDGAARRTRLAEPARALADEMIAGLDVAAGDLSAQDATLQKLDADSRQLLGTYNTERAQVAALVNRQDHEAGKAAPARARAAPCPEPTTPVAADANVRVLASAGDLEEFYPVTEKHNYLEGAVVVEVTVSATGCAQSAAVYDSSGVEGLDEAAVNYVLTACRFRPASVGSQATAKTLLMRMKFKLTQ